MSAESGTVSAINTEAQLRLHLLRLIESLSTEIDTILTRDAVDFTDNPAAAHAFRQGHIAGSRSALARTAADLRRILAEVEA